MWLLAIKLTILTLLAGHPHAHTRTVTLAYPTRHTCQDASDRLDEDAILAGSNRILRRRGPPEHAIKLSILDCATASQDRDGWWDGDRTLEQ